MKNLELSSDERLVLKTPLESVVANSSVTVKDLRRADKICELLEKTDIVALEDSDYDYLKSKFDSFPDWNPAPQFRKLILSVAEKLG